MTLVAAGHSMNEILNDQWQGCSYNGWPLLVFVFQLRAAVRSNNRNRLKHLDDIVFSNNISYKDSKELSKHRKDLIHGAHNG